MNQVKRLSRVILIIAAAAMLWGCTSTQTADLQDCGRLSVGLGLGLDATAKIGSAAHLGLGLVGSRTVRIGCEDREWYGMWGEDQFVWPYEWYRRTEIFKDYPDLRGRSSISAYTRDYYPEGIDEVDPSMDVTYIFPVFEPYPMRKAAFSYGELTDLEVGMTLGIVSARIGINPLEIIDALGGLFFEADIANDDSPVEPCAHKDEIIMKKNQEEMMEKADPEGEKEAMEEMEETDGGEAETPEAETKSAEDLKEGEEEAEEMGSES